MLWLQSNENYACVAKFEPVEGSLKKYSRNEMSDGDLDVIDGFFSEIKGGILMLYRTGDNLFFRAYDSIFILDEHTLIEVSGPRNKRKLSVITNGQVVFKTTYTLTEPGPIPDDPTPFVESEDFDFGVFVSNVSKNSKRKAILLGKA